MSDLPLVWADFNKRDHHDRLVLSTVGSRESLARLGSGLRAGMAACFYTENDDRLAAGTDLDSASHERWRQVSGHLEFDAASERWVGRVNWDEVRSVSMLAGPGLKGARAGQARSPLPIPRFWQRALLIVGATVVAFIAGVSRGRERSEAGELAFILFMIALAVGANGALFAWLRCPSCGKWACRRPGSGRGTVWPGLRCRFCETEY